MINFKKISEIAQSEIENNEKIREALLKNKWKEIFCDELKEISISYIRNNIIYVNVKNAIEKHYIYINKNKILNKIHIETNFIYDDIQII